MKLTLDHTQRLNLHALLGAQRADVGSIRAIWSIQDRIALEAEEDLPSTLRMPRISHHRGRYTTQRMSQATRGVHTKEAKNQAGRSCGFLAPIRAAR